MVGPRGSALCICSHKLHCSVLSSEITLYFWEFYDYLPAIAPHICNGCKELIVGWHWILIFSDLLMISTGWICSNQTWIKRSGRWILTQILFWVVIGQCNFFNVVVFLPSVRLSYSATLEKTRSLSIITSWRYAGLHHHRDLRDTSILRYRFNY